MSRGMSPLWEELRTAAGLTYEGNDPARVDALLNIVTRVRNEALTKAAGECDRRADYQLAHEVATDRPSAAMVGLASGYQRAAELIRLAAAEPPQGADA